MIAGALQAYYKFSTRFPWLGQRVRDLYFIGVKCENWLRYGDPYFFKWVSFENSTKCNRRCGFCPVSTHPMPDELMPWSTFKKVVEELKGYKYDRWVGFSWYSEPLLDSRLVEMIAHVRAELPRCSISFPTNGDVLTESVADELVKAGVSRVVVSNYDEVTEEREVLLKYLRSNYPRIFDIRDFRPENASFNRGGSIDVPNAVKFDTCENPSWTAQITWDGDVVLCCNDFFREATYGNVNDERLADIWAKPEYKSVRTAVRKGQYDLPLCIRCQGKGDCPG